MNKKIFCQPLRSFALVFALVNLALVAGLVVSFISLTQSNQLLVRYTSQDLQGRLDSQAAMQMVVSEIFEEIKDSSETQLNLLEKDQFIYSPRTPQDIVMKRDSGLIRRKNLLVGRSGGDRISKSALVSSGIETSQGNRKGRPLKAYQWEMPQLEKWVNRKLPEWIYLTPQGILTNITSGESSLKVLGPQGKNPVIGRFAYAIYDLGGQLDFNKIGAPQQTTEDEIGLKGSMAYWQLDGIPGFSKKIGNELSEWRNSREVLTQYNSTSENQYLSEFSRYQEQFEAVYGSDCVHERGNRFLSRRDLLLGKGVLFPDDELILNRATFISPELNRPYYDPKSMSGGSFSPTINRNFSKIQVKNSFNRIDGTLAIPGEPLVKNRFSLTALDWVTMKGVKTGVNTQKFIKTFGLQWNNSLGYWEYVGSDGSKSVQDRILKLDEVLALNREPNFFELLKATILDGSLGLDAGWTFSDLSNFDNKSDYQIIRIGLHLIDQYDSNSYPTVCHFGEHTFYGNENLPYPESFSKLAGCSYDSGTGQYVYPFRIFHFFQLWNPYQEPMSTDLTQYPSFIEIKINSGSVFIWDWNTIPLNGYSLNTMTPIQLASSTFNNYRNAPQVTQNAIQGVKLGDFESVSSPYANFVGHYQQTTALNGTPHSGFWAASAIYTNVNIGISYLSPQGVKVPYAHFSGVDDQKGKYKELSIHPIYKQAIFNSAPGDRFTESSGFWVNYFPQGINEFNIDAFKRSDARGTRFGVQRFPTMKVNKTIRPQDGTLISPYLTAQGAAGMTESGSPFYLNSSKLNQKNYVQYGTEWTQNNYYQEGNVSNMAENRWNRGAPLNIYRDRDGIQRWGDSGWDPGGRSGAFTINPMSLLSTTNRPVLLDRRFQSVADIGYTYRDMPWKTLDFFTTNSADAGLLEVFSARDQRNVVEGKVNLFSISPEVLAGILEGTERSPKVKARSSPDLISRNDATIIAKDLIEQIDRFGNQTPLSKTELITKLMSTETVNSTYPATKFRREAPLRALAESLTMRTWNLMIDLAYQKGVLTPNAKSLQDFSADNVQRLWLHVSIDRITGKIIHYQIENVFYDQPIVN